LEDQGGIDHQGFFLPGVAVTSHDDVDALNFLGQEFIFRDGFCLPQPAVGKADDHVHLFLFPQDLHHLPGSFDRIPEPHRGGKRGLFRRIFSHDSENPDFDPALFEDHIRLYHSLIENLFQGVIPVALFAEDGVGKNNWRHSSLGHRRMKNPGQAFRLEVKFVISQGQDIILHRLHQAKFHGLFPGKHMEEGTHVKIPGVQHEDRMIPLLPFLF